LHRLKTHSFRALAASLLVSAIVTPVVAELPPMERLVPRETILLWHTPNVTSSWERVRTTPLGDFLVSDHMQELLKELRDDAELGEMLRDAEVESLAELLPTGRVGFAAFLELDEELGIKRPMIVLAGEWGDRAEKIEKALERMNERLLAEGATIERQQIRGRTVTTRELPKPEPVEEDLDDFDFDPFGGLGIDPTEALEGLRTLHFVRDEGRIVVSSSLLAIDDILGAVDGDALRSSLADNPEFQEALAQLGGAHDSHLILFTAPLQQLLGQTIGAPLAMVQPFITQLFGDIRAHSLGIEFGAGEAMMTATVGTLVPRGRVGLLTLVDGAAPRGPLPAFVGADAIGYGTMSLRLDRLMPLMRNIVQGLPPMFGDMASPMLDQFGPALEQAFGGLGPDMHTVNYPPTNPDDVGETVYALRCTRLEAVNSLVAMLGPGIGLMPRDFLGQTIYSGGDEVPMAIGLGGGWMVLGSDEGVERVLRSIGQADLPTLADEAAFRQAFAAIPAGELLGWGFSDTIATLRAQQNMLGNVLGAGMIEVDVDQERIMKLLKRLTDPEMLKKHVGPQAWTFESRGDGLVYRTMSLRPTAAD